MGMRFPVALPVKTIEVQGIAVKHLAQGLEWQN
jgi:hypothetical protein